MNDRGFALRVAFAVLCVGWLTPVVAVGAAGFGAPAAVGLAIGFAIAVCVTRAIRSMVAWTADLFAAGHPIWLGLVLLAGLAAVVSTARLATFMADPARVERAHSAPSFRGHSCLLAYAEGCRFAQAGDRNIYHSTEYQGRQIVGLRVDPYHYPPPFLLLPGAIDLVTRDFTAFRAVWFMMQALLFVAALLLVARWIGGEYGAWAAGVTWLLLASAPVLTTLQVGNFQLSVLAIAMIAMILLARERLVGGAALLAYATVSKIFPGLLIVYLVAGKRWRAVIFVTIAGALFGAATIAAFGWRPIVDFATYEVPRIANGEAFPQAERPGTIPLNFSFYGLLVRLRHLGLAGLDVHMGLTLTSLYGIVALLLAAAAGWRVARAGVPTTSRGRLVLAQLFLALLSVASFRSPFVGSVYGFVPTMWLAVLLAAGAPTTMGRVAWLMMLAVLHATQVLTPTPPPPPAITSLPSMTVLASTALVLASVIILNVGVVVRVLLRGELDVEPGTARPRVAPVTATVA